jgi:hypothetical protein
MDRTLTYRLDTLPVRAVTINCDPADIGYVCLRHCHPAFSRDVIGVYCVRNGKNSMIAWPIFPSVLFIASIFASPISRGFSDTVSTLPFTTTHICSQFTRHHPESGGKKILRTADLSEEDTTIVVLVVQHGIQRSRFR